MESSSALKLQLDELDLDWSRARLFTADAVSMYTNIDTEHALHVLSEFFRTDPFCTELEGFDADTTIEALRLVMSRNVFKFGDTFWHQLSGTAMGTPPSCCYAMLYFYLNERKFLPDFCGHSFRFLPPVYRRFIRYLDPTTWNQCGRR